ncbi:butyrate kinase [Clostridium sp. Cult2]|uniref:butyrate kinase n=1 Tax=Clostridium sp. Cult2 TaxID=2079003 RepID=UPI001F00139F|nr:butyrate kinase [Clostridium sp. Cult2]MCF6466754.1 butyrate kinase [Clostridium sp. Cult2]
MNKTYRILVINPGSTSTKIAIYENEKEVITETIKHSADEIKQFETIYSQLDFRKNLVLEVLKKNNIDLNTIDAIAGRGGNMKPVAGGTYLVNEPMIEDLKVGVMGQHASNLGGIIAHEIGKPYGLKAYVVDPVVVDEFEEISRISGMPEIPRKSKDHPLNSKAVARKAAKELGAKYDELNIITAHLGGGISIGIHKKGRVVDVNNALDGDGPFSPERAGGLPVGGLVDLCFSGEYTKAEIRKKIVGNGGLVAYLGTNDGREVQEMINNGDKKAELVYKAMAYQIAKAIGASATVVKGNVDAIVLTGGLAFDKVLMGWIEESVNFISKVFVYPGEYEMVALTEGVIRVLNGEEELKEYK